MKKRNKQLHSHGPGGLACFLILGMAMCLLCGCRSSRLAHAGVDEDNKSLRYLDIKRYLPPAHFHSILCLQPIKLQADPFWHPLFTSVLHSQGVAEPVATRKKFGQVKEFCHAQYHLGSLSVIDTKSQEGILLDEIEAYSLSRKRQPTDETSTYRESLRFPNRQGLLVGLRSHFLALSLDDPSLARLALARAEGKMDHLPSALETKEFNALTHAHSSAALSLYLKGPYANSPSLLLQNLLAAMISVEHEGNTLKIELNALGAWPGQKEFEHSFVQEFHQLLKVAQLGAFNTQALQENPRLSCLPSDQATYCHLSLSYFENQVASALSTFFDEDLTFSVTQQARAK